MSDDSKLVKPAGRPKPPAAGKGRQKGSMNRLTRTIKEAIEAAFEKAGGVDYLARMADEQPVAFMTLLGKVLPTQIDANVKADIGMPVIQLGVQPE
jgi:hypothetical protein